LTFPEGFVATFRRLPDDAVFEPGCVFFTVVGHDYDPDQVARYKRAMFQFQPEPVPDELRGVWRAQMGRAEEGSVEIELTIDESAARFLVRSLEPPRDVLLDLEAPIEVSGDFLRSRTLACGAVHHFSLTDGVLQLTVSDEPPLRLGK